jgi:hypothetical protein
MSAGDAVFIGWKGTTPLYYEMEPTVNYEPVRLGTEINPYLIRKRLTRRLICASVDKETVIASLSGNDSVITSVYLDAAGAVQSRVFGGGWYLLSMDESLYKTGFTLISAVWERPASRTFEMDLPTNVTIAYPSAGVAQIKYKTVVLEQYATNSGSSGAGLLIQSEILLPDLPPQQSTDPAIRAAYYNEQTWYNYWMELDSIRFDSIELTGNLIKRRQYVNDTVVVAGPLPTAPTNADLQSVVTSTGAVKARTVVEYATREIDAPFTDTAMASFSNGIYTNAYGISPTTKIQYVRVPQYFIHADFVNQLPHAYPIGTTKKAHYYSHRNQADPPKIKWSLASNILKLKIDDVDWKVWDVSGL